MNVGSLFSGIGGLDCGLARAGFRHAFLCESDPWRRGVLRERFPGVPVYDDVRAVGESAGRTAANGHRAPADDGGWEAGTGLLCGGFPCQDLSVAGQRRGLMHEGGRSNLFFEFARIIESLRPGWVLVENVPGLLSSNGGRDFGILLGTLADLGYGVAWRVLDSRFFGVPQRRRRVFIVGAVAVDDPRAAAGRAGEVLAVGSRCPRHPATRGEAGADVAGTLGGGAGERGWAQDVERMTFIPALTTRAGNTLDDQQTGRRREDDENLVASTITATYGTKWNGNAGAFSGGNFAPTTDASVRRLTPTECERLQALPDGWTNPHGDAPDGRRYAGLGDAVTASVGEWIGRRIMDAA